MIYGATLKVSPNVVQARTAPPEIPRVEDLPLTEIDHDYLNKLIIALEKGEEFDLEPFDRFITVIGIRDEDEERLIKALESKANLKTINKTAYYLGLRYLFGKLKLASDEDFRKRIIIDQAHPFYRGVLMLPFNSKQEDLDIKNSISPEAEEIIAYLGSGLSNPPLEHIEMKMFSPDEVYIMFYSSLRPENKFSKLSHRLGLNNSVRQAVKGNRELLQALSEHRDFSISLALLEDKSIQKKLSHLVSNVVKKTVT